MQLPAFHGVNLLKYPDTCLRTCVVIQTRLHAHVEEQAICSCKQTYQCLTRPPMKVSSCAQQERKMNKAKHESFSIDHVAIRSLVP